MVRGSRIAGTVAIASLVLVGGAATAGAVEATTHDNPTTYDNYVALGDSYASGVGAGEYGDSGDCKRSANAYPQLYADAGGIGDFRSVACLGANTHDVRAQADSLSADTDLVTLSVGGNDAGFVDVMIDCTTSFDQGCIDRVDEAKEFADTTLPGLLDGVYDEIRANAPDAEVFVFGYPRFYEIDGSCNAGLSDTKRAAINSGADALAETISERARAAGFTFVDVRDDFAGHEICSDDWWMRSVTWPIDESYHPTATGHELGYLPALQAAAG
ncbi:SGNH/GDSL hydrolase family protein [Prauserella halophila]|uniref:SGNH/GDSL hydrolase family protein n=1 Tax=Prauserella halophila TaxID=185641 RepID=A0ABN1W6P8_9PSEU|nr:SGNH/GDSL hydrolase family protein [Prauserella halophila]MCP2236115.1 GDSL-like Lipase/Acylhydrolase family protein [Prauserella halophila]